MTIDSNRIDRLQPTLLQQWLFAGAAVVVTLCLPTTQQSWRNPLIAALLAQSLSSFWQGWVLWKLEKDQTCDDDFKESSYQPRNLTSPNDSSAGTARADLRVETGWRVKVTEGVADRAAPSVVQPRLVRLWLPHCSMRHQA